MPPYTLSSRHSTLGEKGLHELPSVLKIEQEVGIGVALNLNARLARSTSVISKEKTISHLDIPAIVGGPATLLHGDGARGPYRISRGSSK